jgi:putative hemolysin
MEIAVLFALILLNGLFAMSELALVTARKWLSQALRGGDQVEWEPWWLEYK